MVSVCIYIGWHCTASVGLLLLLRPVSVLSFIAFNVSSSHGDIAGCPFSLKAVFFLGGGERTN